MLKYALYGIPKPVKIDYDFKAQNSFDKRKNYSDKIKYQYMDMIPVIVEKSGMRDVKQINKTKYLVNKNKNVGEFLFDIRKQLNINSNESLFLFINNKVIPGNNERMGIIYNEHMDPDGFLYITYTLENVFG